MRTGYYSMIPNWEQQTRDRSRGPMSNDEGLHMVDLNEKSNPWVTQSYCEEPDRDLYCLRIHPDSYTEPDNP